MQTRVDLPKYPQDQNKTYYQKCGCHSETRGLVYTVGDVKRITAVVAVKVTPATNNYLKEQFLTQSKDQRICIVGQLFQEVFHGRAVNSVALYTGIINRTDFTPSNLTLLELQVGDLQEKVWTGKKLEQMWVKSRFSVDHKAIEEEVHKDKFLMPLKGDSLCLKSNNFAMETYLVGGQTEELPGQYALKCQNFAGVGQVAVQKTTLHPGASIYQNPEIDQSLIEGKLPKEAPFIEYKGECVATFYGDQNPKEGTPTKVWHFLVSYPIYNQEEVM